MEHILATSNPEQFKVLPERTFKREIVAKGSDYFHNKIIIMDDLIVTFEGMATKQREQLINFWTKLLEGNYARDRNALSNVSTFALFGLASEQLDRFRDELMSSTFLDRVPPFRHNVSLEMKREILQFRAKLQHHEKSYKPPTLKLPLPETIDDSKKVQVSFPRSRDIENRIVEFALGNHRRKHDSLTKALLACERTASRNAFLALRYATRPTSSNPMISSFLDCPVRDAYVVMS